ncbi:DNA-binding LytR/AlgR family response regulator [Hymenobacter luteus]|uniref:DNA-binding LytR/AlgR family response regulator n=2 Tax=Hymenobacter TaxID=89966 RepID=A0A7W9SZX1_9BACT|nr:MULTISPECIES: LytTR family DNA-binding domain-containing protein [Hymenobacter]MBB4600952.1 DNA-binding LytR/AlgR family response regulator [Hymenobacter latericoloratus]MBB6058841.1 DNA-binding LytR/AlgR family response regulator [Hymenobacter luteus]
MKITCLLLDDDPLVLDLLQAYVVMTDILDVKAAFTDPLEAHRYLMENQVQVLFSDVTMPHLSGLDLVRSLQQPPLVVLMTAYPQYAMEGFNLDVIDFLLKPISLDRFLRAVNKVAGILRVNTVGSDAQADALTGWGSFFIRTDAQFVRLHYREVLYIEALKDFTKINTSDGRTHLTLVNLKNLEEQLPPGLFIRTHRSYLVNAARIDSVSNLEVKVGGHALPLGQTYRERVTERIVNRSLIRRQN